MPYRDSLKIGLILAEQGPAGLWAPSAIACAQLAIREINASGGLLGRRLDLVTVDCGPDAETATENTLHALEVEGVEAILGMFPSYARQGVIRANRARVPFLYTPQFEGSEDSRLVITTGETARELLETAVNWLIEHRHARRFFLCGNNYRWPRNSCDIAREVIRRAGAEVVGEGYVAIDCQEYEPLLRQIRLSRADVVLPHFLGSDAIGFNRSFAEAGLARRTLRCAFGLDETIVYGLEEGMTENLYTTSGYFSALRSSRNAAFLERYHALHGASPPPANAYGQSCYEGLYTFAALAERSGDTRAEAIRAGAGPLHLRRSARGPDGHAASGQREMHLAAVNGYDFDILHTKAARNPAGTISL
ncbi:substrate-binding domain-containing protein [Pseudogemmobacter humi]|uniref:Aliphatic amidase expression-regulating protein n=1 Tax=Pseudogemmobacter humi TaxID=2483812 RepID=A0A3P5X7U0_9RHOB|nr:substrate-binding domain-containing protein [Pseudogemmobacter humi]VDC30496.1 Aliphatic amidase expression-regulating protein [Pseudogemmobacter humi]